MPGLCSSSHACDCRERSRCSVSLPDRSQPMGALLGLHCQGWFDVHQCTRAAPSGIMPLQKQLRAARGPPWGSLEMSTADQPMLACIVLTPRECAGLTMILGCNGLVWFQPMHEGETERSSVAMQQQPSAAKEPASREQRAAISAALNAVKLLASLSMNVSSASILNVCKVSCWHSFRLMQSRCMPW